MEQATSRDGQRSNTRLVQESPTPSCRAHQSIGVISQWEFADYIPETEPVGFVYAKTLQTEHLFFRVLCLPYCMRMWHLESDVGLRTVLADCNFHG